jgi:hypothetical protein
MLIGEAEFVIGIVIGKKLKPSKIKQWGTLL